MCHYRSESYRQYVSEWFIIMVGLRQGCVPLWLRNVCMNCVLREDNVMVLWTRKSSGTTAGGL